MGVKGNYDDVNRLCTEVIGSNKWGFEHKSQNLLEKVLRQLDTKLWNNLDGGLLKILLYVWLLDRY